METIKERIDGLMRNTIVPALNEDFASIEKKEAMDYLKHQISKLQIYGIKNEENEVCEYYIEGY